MITLSRDALAARLLLDLTALSVSRFEFTWIDLAVTSLLANQPIASESKRARDRCQRTAVTPQVNLSFRSRQLTVSVVVSAIFVFRLVDSILSSSLHIVH